MWSRLAECWIKCFTGGEQLITEPSKIELMPKPETHTAPAPAQTRAYVPLKSNTEEEEEGSANGDNLDLDGETVEKRLEKALKEALEIIEDPDLPICVEKEGVKVWGKVSSRGYQLRTKWKCAASKEKFIKFVRNFAIRTQWDRNVQESRVVSRLPANATILYQQYKKVFAVSSRDILLACKTYAQEKALIEVSTSVESPAYPPRDPVIRAKVYTGGYYVEEVDAETTEVTAFSEMDFGGVLPHAAMLKMSGLAMPAFARSINTALDKAI